MIASTRKPELWLIGGFLGAGKTTAIQKLAQVLAKSGIRAAAITNDQAAGLVDTVYLSENGVISEEVSGSCFCCNFEGLQAAIRHVVDKENPSVILAEPVGSCTDIVATVVRPLKTFFHDVVDVKSYSVLVEPHRFLEPKQNNTPWSVKYLHKKQLEEADLIVLTKSDIVSTEMSEELQGQLATSFDNPNVISISAKNNIGLESWVQLIQETPLRDHWLQDLDYKMYADAEAEMGWLNAQIRASFSAAIDPRTLMIDLNHSMRKELLLRNGYIGHLKIIGITSTGSMKSGCTTMENECEFDGAFNGPTHQLSLTINMRASVSPSHLYEINHALIMEVSGKYKATIEDCSVNTFRPGAPNPTHRIIT